MSREILSVKNLNTYCPSPTGKGPDKLLDSVNIVVEENDILALIGETGAGKSVLIDSIGRNLKPPLWLEAEKLSVTLDSRQENLLEKGEEELRNIWGRGIAFIPSNAREALNPMMRVGEQFCNIIQANGLAVSYQEAHERAIEMFKKVQMPDPRQNFFSYPHELSGGMAQRVVISIALSMAPRLLLADEPTMGLDVTIQKQVLDLMLDLVKEFKSSVIFATRDLGIVAHYCNKVAAMRSGQIVEFAEVKDFFKNARHPYSHELLRAAFASHGMDKQNRLVRSNQGESRVDRM